MIISKTPFRIPFAGGGTDIDFYYKNISLYKQQGGNIDDLDREHIFRMILIQLLKENVMDSSKIMQQVVTDWKYFKKKKSENDDVLRNKLKNERLKYNSNETNEKNSKRQFDEI